MKFFPLKPEAFGLDISDLSLKILDFKKEKKGVSIASFGEDKIEKGIISRGAIKKEKDLIDIIKKSVQSVKGRKLKTKYVIASLPEEKAFLQVIKMPPLSEDDLKSAVIYEAENYIPLPIEKVYLDFQVVPYLHDHHKTVDVLIAALPREIVDSYLRVLKGAGLEPLAFEVESQSIARALIKRGVTKYPVLIVDLGSTRTSFVIYSGYSIRFTSSVPVASWNFTQLISKNLGVSFKEAEAIKKTYGLGSFTAKDKTPKVINEKKGKLFDILIPALVDLVQQIKRYLEFYNSHSPKDHLSLKERTISKVILGGGGAYLKGLREWLSLELQLPVEIGNPWINVELKDKKDFPSKKSLGFTTAIGLALRGIGYD